MSASKLPKHGFYRDDMACDIEHDPVQPARWCLTSGTIRYFFCDECAKGLQRARSNPNLEQLEVDPREAALA